MSKTIIQQWVGQKFNTFKNKLKWHPHNIHIEQKLCDEDKANCCQFTFDNIASIEADPMHLALLVGSDEAKFHLDGSFICRNHHP